MRVAVANLEPAASSAEALDSAAGLAAAAAAAGADLLLLPQRFLGGGWSAAAAPEPSDGPGARAMGAMARQAGLAIAYGYAERCSGALHDSLLLVDRTGGHLANYRRAHVAPGENGDGATFARGHWLSTMPVAGRRVGLLVGYDVMFPEAARVLRLAACDLILVAGGLDPGAAAVAALLPARALENRCAVAFASADPRRRRPPWSDPTAPASAGPPATPPGALVLADLPPRTLWRTPGARCPTGDRGSTPGWPSRSRA
jgi:predicted amidohydrolase